MNRPSNQKIAAIVDKYFAGRQIDGISFETDAARIWQGDNWWRVPVRPSRWPRRMFPIYEEMAEAEQEIADKENLNILLHISEPLTETDQEQAEPAVAA
jgi:hypothetical protein